MKKYISILSIATAAVIAFGSCSKDITSSGDNTGKEAESQSKEYQTVSLTANAAQYQDEDAAKVSSKNDVIQWNSKDSLIVWSLKDGSYLRSVFNKTNPTGAATSATFTGEILTGSTPTLVSYPSGDSVNESGHIKMSMKVRDNPFLQNSVTACNPEIGKITSGTVALKNVCGYLRVKCPAADASNTIHRVVVKANTAGEYLAVQGMTVVYNNGDPTILSYDTGYDYVELNLSDLVAKNKADGYYLIPVKPGTYKGITVTAYGPEDKVVFTKTGTSDLVVTRSKITNLGVLSDEPQPEEKITVNITPLNSTTVSGTIALPTEASPIESSTQGVIYTWTLKSQNNYTFTIGGTYSHANFTYNYWFDASGNLVTAKRIIIGVPTIANYHVTKLSVDVTYDEVPSANPTFSLTRSNAGAPTAGTRLAADIAINKSEFPATKTVVFDTFTATTSGKSVFLWQKNTPTKMTLSNFKVEYELDK